MTPQLLRDLLERVARGELGAEQALEQIRHLPFRDVDAGRIDHHRELRTGIPEVIFGAGKSAEQIVAIAREMADRGSGLLVTRIEQGPAAALMSAVSGVEYFPAARLAMRRRSHAIEGVAASMRVAVVSAGTSDAGVAEEAALTLEFLGIQVRRHCDVGVAGIHRLLADRTAIGEATVVIVVAGMEGALPSVVAGLIDRPVIAVPTSVGYGASFGGLAALLSMMTSCAPGITVVNIDNGFGAAVAAAAILRAIGRGGA
ncbi:MAG TPA: nickel pincer cofactor biosynthesis protein LarB [Candidatus Limnocylindrales bacterium]|nr:nickel pincer cofactor biosynthesis protein LarB [Candidatus Limnocylindrales bacterium]